MIKDYFYIEFVDFLGEIRNDTLINGKAFIFKILDIQKEYSFEAILFVHINAKPFLTIADKHYKILESDFKTEILNTYNIKELLNYKKDEN